ncbi:hypothetical protein [Oryzomonas sagensis]|nr:hypothetical protein [Oryzomonas sagensis]
MAACMWPVASWREVAFFARELAALPKDGPHPAMKRMAVGEKFVWPVR